MPLAQKDIKRLEERARTDLERLSRGSRRVRLGRPSAECTVSWCCLGCLLFVPRLVYGVTGGSGALSLLSLIVLASVALVASASGLRKTGAMNRALSLVAFFVALFAILAEATAFR